MGWRRRGTPRGVLGAAAPSLALALVLACSSGRAVDVGAPCCEFCNASRGLAKYTSIDAGAGHCGETCLRPLLFWMYRAFEPGLSLARSETPCADAGYGFYLQTTVHGHWPLAVELDLYDPGSGNNGAHPAAATRSAR